VDNAQQAAVASFLCPSDARSKPGVSEGGSFAFLGDAFGLTSYLAVEGSSYESGDGKTYANLGLIAPRDGVIYGSSATRMVEIRDGTSNTVLVGERPPMPAGLDWGWWAWGPYDSALAAVDNRLLPYPDCAGPAVYGPGRVSEPCDALHFWSFHPGGANWLFADGSIHFVRYSAAPVLPALATRAGSESVQAVLD
jgi:prepilin-type processing-associated H-X9-DG protein